MKNGNILRYSIVIILRISDANKFVIYKYLKMRGIIEIVNIHIRIYNGDGVVIANAAVQRTHNDPFVSSRSHIVHKIVI
jgi:hypothetical protein